MGRGLGKMGEGEWETQASTYRISRGNTGYSIRTVVSDIVTAVSGQMVVTLVVNVA